MLRVKEISRVVNKDWTKEKNVENDKLYDLVDSFVGAFTPSESNTFDTRWMDFYLPAKYNGKEAALPFSVMKYDNKYWVSFEKIGAFVVSHGNKEVSSTYSDLINSAASFDKASDKDALEKIVPLRFRTGKIERRHVDTDAKLMSKEESDAILTEYEKHKAALKPCKAISLNNYLKAAAIAYSARRNPDIGFKNEDESKLSLSELYKRHADGRHGYMLDIKNPDSARQFSKWQHSKVWEGSHPFEIVFGPTRFGIHLWPPSSTRGCNSFRFDRNYVLSVGDSAFYSMYVRMTQALMTERVPFKAPDLEKSLEFLRGDSEFTVNRHSNEHIDYTGARWEKKEMLPHIKWDELKVLKRR
jgi:hypothetical protein